MTIDLIRSRGQHRRPKLDFWVVVLFWAVVVALAGFIAGWVWAQAVAL